MPIAVVCRGCHARLNAPDTAAGKRVKCPKCGAAMTVPAPAADEDFEVVDDEPALPKRKPAVADDDEDDDEDDRPQPKKKKKGRKAAPKSNLPLILGVGGGILVLAVVGVVLALTLGGKKDDTAKATGSSEGVVKSDGQVKPQSNPMQTPPREPPAGWELFERPEFSIYFPQGNGPPLRNEMTENQVKAQFPNAQVWAKRDANLPIAYLVVVVPYTAQQQAQYKSDKAAVMRELDSLITQGKFLGSGGNVQFVGETTLNGIPCRKFIVTAGPIKSVVTLALGTSSLVLASVSGKIESEDDPQSKPFFDSFQPK